MPEELWVEVCNIIQQAVIKISTKKKKCKKAKWLSEESLQIAENSREAKAMKKKIYPSKCRVPKNSKKKYKSLPK